MPITEKLNAIAQPLVRRKNSMAPLPACDLDFSECYGEIVKGFIEAHHLKTISTLVEVILQCAVPIAIS